MGILKKTLVLLWTAEVKGFSALLCLPQTHVLRLKRHSTDEIIDRSQQRRDHAITSRNEHAYAAHQKRIVSVLWCERRVFSYSL